MNRSTQQYAPWSEDTEEDEAQLMSKEQMVHAADRVIARMRRPRPQEPRGLHKPPKNVR